jgi:hypothetical protein
VGSVLTFDTHHHFSIGEVDWKRASTTPCLVVELSISNSSAFAPAPLAQAPPFVGRSCRKFFFSLAKLREPCGDNGFGFFAHQFHSIRDLDDARLPNLVCDLVTAR